MEEFVGKILKHYKREDIIVATGIMPHPLDWKAGVFSKDTDIAKFEKDDAIARAQMTVLYEKMTEAEKKAFQAEEGVFPRKGTTLHIDMALSPWFRKFVSFDPQDALKKVKCPSGNFL